jgi:hypothetical protein
VTQAYLRIGKPDEQIVALAEEIGAGMIVMDSRGLGGIRRLLMGIRLGFRRPTRSLPGADREGINARTALP